MATQTQSTPTNPISDNNPLNPERAQASLNDGQATPEKSQTSVFVNSEPIREEQVQNAIKFLSHPRVRGSPVLHRRNFLEKKGLTKEEIDEAFRRVPDPSPAATTSGQPSTNHDGQAMMTTTSTVSQAPVQAMQPTTAEPTGVMSTMMKQFHWSHAVLTVGFLAISGAGTVIVLKNSVIPRLKSWIRTVVQDEDDLIEHSSIRKLSLAEEATAAAKSAADAAADVAKASQEMLITKNEEKKCFAEFLTLLDVQIHEMRTIRNAISKLEAQSNNSVKSQTREEYLDGSSTRSMPRGLNIEDPPPNPSQTYSNPNFAPRSKPWEVNHHDGNSSFISQPQVVHESSNYPAQDNIVTNYQLNNGDDRPPMQRWVPPQRPPVSMAEAGVAIRQPKSSSIVNVCSVRADEIAQHVNGLEELQRVTHMSEYGGNNTYNNEIEEQILEV